MIALNNDPIVGQFITIRQEIQIIHIVWKIPTAK